MGVQVLLIEDDATIAEPLSEGLMHYGLPVTWVATGADGLAGPYGDVVLLDLGLPDMDGIDVCRRIRQVSDVPVIILTARGEEADRILGLKLGADDYLAKPFSLRELIARIRAVFRRTQRCSHTAWDPVPGAFPAGAYTDQYQEQAFTRTEERGHGHLASIGAAPAAAETPVSAVTGVPGHLVVDRRTHQVWAGQELVALTPKEFGVLALLCEDPGAVYSRQQILDHVWDPYYQGPTKTLDVHVASLRRKLGHPEWIQTLRGVGFRLAVHAAPPQPGDGTQSYAAASEAALP
ncbi:response regulator transcription factor [Streptomyces sp. NPDC047860]|uniref:response regulator transcription factor n=1 Tax=Streptomyces sp. NPDC047860 TaxID=3155743 RepID=UPI0034042D52